MSEEDFCKMEEASQQWSEVYNLFKKHHDDAFFVIEKGIRFEEQGKCEEAVLNYEKGLALIDKALQLRLECPANPDDTWEKASAMVQKIKITRKEVLSRVAAAQSMDSSEAIAPPPSYEEALRTSEPVSQYKELNLALQDMKVQEGSTASEVLFIQEGVKIYFISPDGRVSAPSAAAPLRIIQFPETDDSHNKVRAFLEVGEWIYPLVPSMSPVLRSDYGAYILPDTQSQTEGAAIGIILPEQADSSVYELLDDILEGFVQQPAKSSVSVSRRFSEGAEIISKGLVKGAEKASEMLNHNTPKLMSKLTPESNPRPVPRKVRKSMQVARNVSGKAVQVSSFLASKIGSATMSLGRYVAPHIQKQGARLLTKTCGMTEQEASNKMNGVLEVAAGAVQGFGTVYTGLEKSAAILAKNLADNTVQIVEYKYGYPMGEVTGDAVYTVGNLVATGHNLQSLGPKGIAKKAAKSTGIALVEDYKNKEKDGGKKVSPKDEAGSSGDPFTQ